MTGPPADLVVVRHTRWFAHDDVPSALLADHRTRADTWGRLEVAEGVLGFVPAPGADPVRVGAGQSAWIRPGVPHRVELTGPVRFRVAFLRRSETTSGL